jgi:hypothetical protein
MLYFMKLFQKIRGLFQPKSEPLPVASTDYSDEDFLNVVMEQARRRTQAEQVRRAATTLHTGTPAFPKAA